jgi:glycine cleavage system P protein (glycine dehydrogenase) subunit 2
MSRATLQPPAGACGEMTGLLMMRAYHAGRGDDRTRVIIPDSAHGTNPASVRLAGFEAVPVPSDANGLVDVAALEQLVDERLAGLMLTNPNTLGLFETDIVRITEIVHRAGGLVYYDGANLNAILGRCRPGDMGFDIVHINTHKTFATPHGGGGPGAGPVGVVEHLVPFLPSPTVERAADGAFLLDHDRPGSIGRMHGFHGNIGVLVRAYAYVFAHGADGLQAVSERAALNANYLLSLVDESYPAAYPARPMHEFVSTARGLKEAYGVRAMDVAKRVIDLGFHPSTVYFPLVVEEAMMMEPTETETKETLEAFAEALLQVAREAAEEPALLHEAPRTTPVRRLDEARAARHLKLRW